MAALVGYASSDDEGDEEQQPQQPQQPELAEAPPKAALESAPEGDKTQSKPAVEPPEPAAATPAELPEPPLVTEPVPQSAVPLGPSLPPMEAPPAAVDDDDQAEAPASPYSASRAAIHDLTLPSVPNLDIPPSPPGSPPPRVSKTFDQFLQLKKNGTHFNRKLEQSTALRNPSVMDKLLEFAGLDERHQYETTLSPDLWDPAAFPDSAFVEKLRKSRETLAKEREADRSSGGRSSIDFVPAVTNSAGTSSSAGGLSRGEKRKGGWK